MDSTNVQPTVGSLWKITSGPLIGELVRIKSFYVSPVAGMQIVLEATSKFTSTGWIELCRESWELFQTLAERVQDHERIQS